MDKFNGLFNVRDGRTGDVPFIISTFLKALYYGDSWFSSIPKDVFMDNYKLVAQSLMQGANTVVKVACLPEDPDVILGYSILSADFQVIHFVYVKRHWRFRGIATALTPRHPTAVTHMTTQALPLMSKLSPAIFNPFKIVP